MDMSYLQQLLHWEVGLAEKASSTLRFCERMKTAEVRADTCSGSTVTTTKVACLALQESRSGLKYLAERTGVALPIPGRFFSCSFFFLFFFCNHASFVFRYKKPYAALAMKRKKPINAIPPPASPLHGKNQTPRVHRESLPCLAPEIIYPRHVRKQYMETYR